MSISIEKLTVEYVKIYQQIYMARQDVFDSLNIFNGKGSIQCSSEQEDFKTIAQSIKQQQNYLRKDMSLVRMFEETLKQCKKQILSYESQYSALVQKRSTAQKSKSQTRDDSQLDEKRQVLYKYFDINQNEQNQNKSETSTGVQSREPRIEITFAI